MKNNLNSEQYKRLKSYFDSYRSKLITKFELAPLAVELIFESVPRDIVRSELFYELRAVMGTSTHQVIDSIIAARRKTEKE